MARCYLVVSIDEKRNEVLLAGHLFLLGLRHRLLVSSILLVVGQHVDNVGHGNFKYDIHTALQVKAEPDLCLKALLVRVDTQILDRILVILLRNRVLDLCCLTVIVACRHRERQVEDTCERQEDGYANY